MPWVETMVPDHRQRLVRQPTLVPDDVVQVLVVTPAEHDPVHPAVRPVDATRGVVRRVDLVRVVGEGGAAVDDALVERTADRKSVAHDVPLAPRVEEVEQLAQVVDQAGELHPAGLAVAADGLGGLEEVLDLRQRGVRVGLVDQGIEPLHRVPDGHPGAGFAVEELARVSVVGYCLLRVLFAVEGFDAVIG